MKKVFNVLFFALSIGLMIIIFSGCQEQTSNKKNNNIEDKTANIIEDNENKATEGNKTLIKDGLYNMVLRAEDVELSAGDICLEISGNLITIGDGFSGSAQQGTFEIKNNKLIGSYTKVTYIDHQNGGNMTEEDISEEFDFDILEDGSLRDNYGYGSKFGHKNFAGRIYRLVEEF